MKNECSIIKDLLPLYVEDMVSGETRDFIEEHLSNCPECKAELDSLKEGTPLSSIEDNHTDKRDTAKPFKKIMKKMSRQFNTLSYSLIVFFVFLGFSFTGGENLMYNSLIMPIVGVFGYYVFRWKAIYKMPILLLAIDLSVCLFKLVELDLYSAVMWTGIYSIFVFIGIAIAFLIHYATRKENE
ncbi:MAG: zf-HC2 domain-containing protein [Clostridia bacterium]|nr:zf-HC2 domain-containing protein [Clostridia bacterium]